MQISEVMQQDLISVNINDTVKKVASIMKEEDIGVVPVMDEGKAVGIVTDRDIIISCIAGGHSTDDPISHAMTEEIISIERDHSIQEASMLMQKNKVSRLLVMDNEKPVGIISLQDLSSYLDESLAGQAISRIKN